MSLEISTNPVNNQVIDDFKTDIYKAAVAYNSFAASIKDKKEIDDVYMISKEYINFFKDKIKYNSEKDYYKKNTNDNFKKFEEEVELNKYSFNDLEEIVFGEFKIYGDLDELEEDIDKGFEFVTKDFLEAMEVEFNYEDYKVKYIQDSNNIIIKFNDNSKLIIFTDKNNQKKYYAIPAPVKSTQDKKFRRTRTICVSRKRKEKTAFISRKSNVK